MSNVSTGTSGTAVKVAGVALLLLLAYSMWPTNKPYGAGGSGPGADRDNDDSIVLILSVERTIGGPAVDVSYTINGSGYSDQSGMRARRWRTSITVRRTDSVSLRAFQGELVESWRPAHDRLTCRIRSSDGTFSTENQRGDIGSVRCYYNRK